MRLAILLGTRPEIIKLSPVVRACQRLQVPFYLVHSGQHYSHAMDGAFFEQLELAPPDYHLGVGSASHGRQTADILARTEEVLVKDRPDAVVVQGDTNTALAGALAACKLGIPVAHIEAGLRSYDRSMPEEINRILVDQISDWLFVPTAASGATLRGEGVAEDKIFVVGNTIVDAVEQNRAIARRGNDILNRMGLTSGNYLLVTVHRQENVDVPERFASLLNGMRLVAGETRLPLVYPMHPRSAKMLEKFGFDRQGLGICEPVNFLDFLALESHARLILTDSGGVQEEACILGVPCVTLRDNTERPETVEVGANVLVGTDAERILHGCQRQLGCERGWRQPLGDGRSGERIVRILAGMPAD